MPKLIIFVSLAVLVLIIAALFLRRRRQPRLTTRITRAEIRAQKPGCFDYQIDVVFSTDTEAAQLHGLDFSHPIDVFGPQAAHSQRPLTLALMNLDEDLLIQSPDSFAAHLKQKESKALSVASIQVSAGIPLHLSFAERFATSPFIDGYQQWPQEGWQLNVRTSQGDFSIPLSFVLHSSNTVDAFCKDYGPARNMVWSC